MSFTTFYKKQPDYFKAAFSFAITVLIIFISFLIFRGLIGNKSNRLLKDFRYSNEKVTQFISQSQIPVMGYAIYDRTFRLQDSVITLRRDHHYRVAMMFFKNYYAITICLIFIYCMGGLLLFYLVHVGWKASVYTVKVVFLTLCVGAVCLNIYTAVFDQKKNFDTNMMRYMNYSKIEMDIANQITNLSKKDYPTIKDTVFGPKKEIKSVSVRNDTQLYLQKLDTILAKNHILLDRFTEYVFSMDASKMKNMKQIYQALLEMKETSTKQEDPKNLQQSPD